MLSDDEIRAIVGRVAEAGAEGGQPGQAWDALQPLLRAQPHQAAAAVALAFVVDHRWLPVERGLDVLAAVAEAHAQDPVVLTAVGHALDGARHLDDLNAAPPDHPLFATLVGQLSARLVAGADQDEKLLGALATATRARARQHDELATGCAQLLVALRPDDAGPHYDLALLHKTRGRFRDGLEAGRAALALLGDGEQSPAYRWNVGICATGAGDGALALDLWRQLGTTIGMGRFDLPEGRYPGCEVRLAERPLAERTASDDSPGREETVWIERLSPCHGIVRSVLSAAIGVDYGDVVLFDGAPITYHRHDDDLVPVFPHLATLRRRHYQLYDFAGTQDQPGQLVGLSDGLPDDAVVYARTERVGLVTGRIAAPPELAAGELLARLDEAVAAAPASRLYAPALCEAAGLGERAAVEQQRFDRLTSNP